MALHNSQVPILGATSPPWKHTHTIPPQYGVTHTPHRKVLLRVFLPDGSIEDYEMDSKSADKIGADLIKHAHAITEGE